MESEACTSCWASLAQYYVCESHRGIVHSCGLFILIACVVFHCVNMLKLIQLVLMDFGVVSSVFLLQTMLLTVLTFL